MNLSKTKQITVLIILSMAAGLMYLTPFLRFSFYDQMKEALALTDIQIGTIGSVYGIAYVVSFAAGGILAQKFRTKKLLIVSCIGMAASTVWYAMYPGYISYIIIHALYGFFSVGTFWSPYLTAVRSLGTEEEQGRIFGSSEALRGIIQAVVSFICLGVLGAAATVQLGFRVVLWINAAAFMALMAATLFLVPDFEHGEDARESNPLKGMVRMLKNPGCWICIFVILCGYTLWATVNNYIGTYCTRVLDIPANISSILSIIRSYIIVFVAGFTGGFLVDRFRTRGQGLLLIYCLGGISAAGILLTENVVFVCMGITVILSYIVNVVKSTYWSILGDAGIPLEDTSIATAVISLIGLTGDIFVPPVISRFISSAEAAGNVAAGFHRMLIWIVVWAVLGMLASFVLKKKKEQILKDGSGMKKNG